MINLILVWILISSSLLIISHFISGFKIDHLGSAMIATITIGFLNAILRPIIFIITLPINMITLGTFTFLINAFILKIAAGILSGFSIDGWMPAIIASIILTVINVLISELLT